MKDDIHKKWMKCAIIEFNKKRLTESRLQAIIFVE